MKKFKIILAIIFSLLLMPITVFAEEDSTVDNRVNIYFFRGEGCPHCAEEEEFLESLQEEYGQYFKIVDYETWYNSDNAKLMKKVADARKETIKGVPYTIIGNKSWSGYSSDFNEEIKSAIMSEYKTEVSERYDIMILLDSGYTGSKSYASDAFVLIAILLVAAGITYGIIAARKKVS